MLGLRLPVTSVKQTYAGTGRDREDEDLHAARLNTTLDDGPSGQHLVPGRKQFAGSTGAVPSLPQFRLAPCELAPGVADSRSHQRQWLHQAVAAVYTGDGSRIDGSRMVAERSAALSRATVASAVAGLEDSTG
jgi:hypothetical protein